MKLNLGKSLRVLALSLVAVASTFAIGAGTSQATPTNDEWVIDQLPLVQAANTVGEASVIQLVCPSAGNCLVGGSYSDPEEYLYQPWAAALTNGTWTTELFPSIKELNTKDEAGVNSITCPSAGNCLVSGSYLDIAGYQPWVATLTNGTWTTEFFPSIKTLNTLGGASVNSITCPSTGNCLIGGDYRDNAGYQPWVATLTNGTWTTELFPRIKTLNTGGQSKVSLLACPSTDNCLVSGSYLDNAGLQPWAATLTNGTWTTELFPSIKTLNTSDFASVNSITCPSTGNCLIGGNYRDNVGHQPWVAILTNGTWTTELFPRIKTLNTSLDPMNISIVCPSTGNCLIGGNYRDIVGFQPWAATLTNGTWTTEEFPRIKTLNTRGGAPVNSITCPSAGNCLLGGAYEDIVGYQPWVATLTNGTWTTEEFPSIKTLNTRGGASVNSITCPSVGNCLLGGAYKDIVGYQPWVATLTNGTWTTELFPSIKTLNTRGQSGASLLACPSTDNCLVGGAYEDSAGYHPWVATLTNGTWTTELFPSIKTLNTRGQALVQSIACPSAGNCSISGKYNDDVGTQVWVATRFIPQAVTTTTMPEATTTTTPEVTSTVAPAVSSTTPTPATVVPLLPATGSSPSSSPWPLALLLIGGGLLVIHARRRTSR